MKKILNANYYYFDPSNNRIDFSNFPEFEFQKLYAVIDISQGRLIYSTAGHNSGLDGSYSFPYLTLTYNVSAFSSSDELQIIYDMQTQPISDSEENPILSTLDIPSEKFGLDINLLNSSFGGQIDKTMPYPFAENAFSVAFNQGGKLRSPAMDTVSNQFIVDVTQNGNIPIYAPAGLSVNQNSYPWLSTLVNSANENASFDAGASDSKTLRVVMATGSVLQALTGNQSFTDVSLTTVTTSATSSGFNSLNYRAQSFQLKVAAVTGTSPTLDYSIEESFDGTTWFKTYDFPRITSSNEVHRTPMIKFIGQYHRYVRTVSGTLPVFNSVQIARINNTLEGDYFRNFIDRTLTVNTINSVTPSYFGEGCTSFCLMMTLNSGGTTMPTVRLQGSDDNINWYALSATVLGVVSSTVSVASTVNINARYVRAIVTTAGVGSTLINVNIKGYN